MAPFALVTDLATKWCHLHCHIELHCRIGHIISQSQIQTQRSDPVYVGLIKKGKYKVPLSFLQSVSCYLVCLNALCSNTGGKTPVIKQIQEFFWKTFGAVGDVTWKSCRTVGLRNRRKKGGRQPGWSVAVRWQGRRSSDIKLRATDQLQFSPN